MQIIIFDIIKGIEESNKLIGIKAEDEEIDKINLFIRKQLVYRKINIDNKILNVHHIGRNLFCELRLIVQNNTENYFSKMCDVCNDLQSKLELFDFVERAFVSFDYRNRNKQLHKIPTLD